LPKTIQTKTRRKKAELNLGGTNPLWEAGQHPQTLKDEWAKEPE